MVLIQSASDSEVRLEHIKLILRRLTLCVQTVFVSSSHKVCESVMGNECVEEGSHCAGQVISLPSPTRAEEVPTVWANQNMGSEAQSSLSGAVISAASS